MHKKGMLSNGSYIELMGRRYEELKRIYSEKEGELRKAPKGDVRIAKGRNRIQYYLRMNSVEKTGKYISKKDKTKIQTYLQKKYNIEILKLVQMEITLIENVIAKFREIDKCIKIEFSKYPSEIKNYIQPIDCSDKDYIEKWLSKSYIGKEIRNDEVVYNTDQGERVRSKSELNIANMLYKRNIPYKYECPLRLKSGNVIYPDFVVLDVKNRRNIYWEHRGMMDDRDYSKHAIQRIKEYQQNGFELGRDLIITEESSVVPLGTNDIEMIIKLYLS